MRPPKAPATGYVLYLNEKRKQYKDLPFPEVKYFKTQGLLIRSVCVMTGQLNRLFSIQIILEYVWYKMAA